MDSKLISSNIAWYSRYEIIHETLVKSTTEEDIERIKDQMIRQHLIEFLGEDAGKTIYRTDSETMGKRLVDLGIVIYNLLQTCSDTEKMLLRRVFGEQYDVDKDGNVTLRDKAKIAATSVQNPNDPDAAYRSKNGKKTKGFSVNITETCDEEDKPNLITDVQVKPANAADNGFVKKAIETTKEVTGNRSVLTFRPFGSLQWKTVTWNQFSLRVKQVSNAMLNLNIKPQENIAVFAQNCIHYLYTDFGAYGVKAVSIPFYATSSETQIQFMINDAQVRVLFVGEQEQYDKALRVFTLCPSLERIIIFDESVRISPNDPNAMYFSDFLKLGEGLPRQTEVENLWKTADFNDICNILYTSGTTGDSKGVVLTYGQYQAALEANDKCVSVGEGDRSISFLPLTHIFERGWAYLCLSEGAEIIINTYPKEIQDSMRQTHPTCMSSVPRFWEKVYQAVKDKIDRSGAV